MNIWLAIPMLQDQLEQWVADRPPFITALIHENNFYRSGAKSWKAYYLTGDDQTVPLDPPNNLNAADGSKPRPEKEQEAIWQAYERMVAYAAQKLKVVTYAHMMEMAK